MQGTLQEPLPQPHMCRKSTVTDEESRALNFQIWYVGVFGVADHDGLILQSVISYRQVVGN